jgi:hypothetical protein
MLKKRTRKWDGEATTRKWDGEAIIGRYTYTGRESRSHRTSFRFIARARTVETRLQCPLNRRRYFRNVISNVFLSSSLVGNLGRDDTDKDANLVAFVIHFVRAPLDFGLRDAGRHIGARFKQQWNAIGKTDDRNAILGILAPQADGSFDQKGTTFIRTGTVSGCDHKLGRPSVGTMRRNDCNGNARRLFAPNQGHFGTQPNFAAGLTNSILGATQDSP